MGRSGGDMAKKKHKSRVSSAIPVETETLHIKDLLPDQNNARLHNPRNVGMIVKSLQEVGAARSGVIDEQGNVLAGNATLEALAQAGIERVKVVEANGNEWVVVRRKGLTEEQKKKLALYDNRTAELAEWDTGILKDLYSENEGLLADMWFDGELAKLLNFNPELDLGGGDGVSNQEDSGSEGPVSLSGVRMVQLFLNSDNFPMFMQMMEFLKDRFEKNNLTDTVVECVNRIYQTEQPIPG